ncbi:MAG: zinc ribbon domain-containing protein, partial [Clostridiales bacterium]|nr:zinc ribbon domain-containing protein [Clostridiales bacterium]
MGRTVMGYWDCPVCGNKGVPGNVMNCPSCGRARGDVRFYMKDGAENTVREENDRGDIEYLNEEQEKEIGKNPDWYCSFCNSLNKDHAAFCSNCGASRESSESNYFDQLKKRQEAEAAEKAAQPQPRETQAPKKSKLPVLLIIAAAVVALVLYLRGNNVQGDLTVTDVSWSRTVPIEQNIEYTESDWSVPAGGTEISRAQAIHHYDQVLDHYEEYEVQRSRQVLDHYETYYTYTDNGNGSFTEVPHERPVYKTEYYTETETRPVYVPVPRYQTKYTYKIWRWTPTREVTASGQDHEAYWPSLGLEENEREGGDSRERYTFTVTSKKGETTVWRVTEEDWRKIDTGAKLTISTGRGNGESWIVDEKGNQL